MKMLLDRLINPSSTNTMEVSLDIMEHRSHCSIEYVPACSSTNISFKTSAGGTPLDSWTTTLADLADPIICQGKTAPAVLEKNMVMIGGCVVFLGIGYRWFVNAILLFLWQYCRREQLKSFSTRAKQTSIEVSFFARINIYYRSYNGRRTKAVSSASRFDPKIKDQKE